MKKPKFNLFLLDLAAVVKRFHIVLLAIFSLAIMALLEINVKSFELEFNGWSFFILTTIASISLLLLLENLRNKMLGWLFLLLSITSIALYSFVFFDNKVAWEMNQFAAILVALLLFISFVLYLKKDTDASFWIFVEKIASEFVTTVVYMSVLQAGLSLALYAVDVLFDVKIASEVYGSLAVVCYLVFAPVYFLLNMPTKNQLYDQTVAYNKFLKILGLNVFLPLLGLYLVILYVYLIKIIVVWELPNGWVTTLVSILALGGYLAKFVLFPISEHKLVRFLNRYFSLLLFPLLVLMTVGLARRIDDYGMSINRLYVLIFNLWLYGVSIYLFSTQSKHLRWLVVSFAFVLFLTSVGPWSVFAITKRFVQQDLITLLKNNKLYVDGQLVDNKSKKIAIPDSIQAAISDKVYYYVTNFGLENWKSAFNDRRKLVGTQQITEYLGVDNYVLNEKKKTVFASHTSKAVYDIRGYNKLITNLEVQQDNALVFSDKNYSIEFLNSNIRITELSTRRIATFSFQAIVSNLYAQGNNHTPKADFLLLKSDRYMLLITNLSADCTSSTNFKIQQLNFNLYCK